MKSSRFRVGSMVAVVKDGPRLREERVESYVGRQVATSHTVRGCVTMHFWWCRSGRGVGAWKDYAIREHGSG